MQPIRVWPELKTIGQDSDPGQVTEYAKGLASFIAELFGNEHVHEVLKIPSDEPIFVLRAQDKFSLGSIYKWQGDVADWQRANPDKVKIPD